MSIWTRGKDIHLWQYKQRLSKSGFPLLDECDKCDSCDGCWCACKMRADPLDVRDGSWVSAENLSAAFQRSFLLTAISVDKCYCTHRISGAPIWKEKGRFCTVDKGISCPRTNNPPGSSIYWASTFLLSFVGWRSSKWNFCRRDAHSFRDISTQRMKLYSFYHKPHRYMFSFSSLKTFLPL